MLADSVDSDIKESASDAQYMGSNTKEEGMLGGNLVRSGGRHLLAGVKTPNVWGFLGVLLSTFDS